MNPTSSVQGAEATLDALTFGAAAYFTKPANMADIAAALTIIREKLVPMIKAIGTRALEGEGSLNNSPATESIPKLTKAACGDGPQERSPRG